MYYGFDYVMWLFKKIVVVFYGIGKVSIVIIISCRLVFVSYYIIFKFYNICDKYMIKLFFNFSWCDGVYDDWSYIKLRRLFLYVWWWWWIYYFSEGL